MFAFWIFKSRQDQNRPNSPPHSQLPTTSQALAGHYWKIAMNVFGILLMFFGCIWFLRGINILPGSFMMG